MKLLIHYDDGRSEVINHVRHIEEDYGQRLDLMVQEGSDYRRRTVLDVAKLEVLEVHER